MSKLITGCSTKEYAIGMRVTGRIMEDIRFPDHTLVTTSPIVEIGSDYIVTKNTRYEILNYDT